jgi:Flp pilus assembly protein CpaB
MAQAPAATRLRRRRQRRIALALALVLAGALAWYLLRPSEARGTRAPERRPGWVEVPVTARDIPVGQLMKRPMLRPQYAPPAEIPPNAILQYGRIMGRVSTRELPAGTYLREDDLGPPGAPPGLSGMAQPGMRVMVVEMGRVAGAAGFLSGGDRVDILAISYPGAGTGTSAYDRRAASANTMEGGGNQPGDPNAGARKRGRAPAPGIENGAVATLIAEDVEIVRPPRQDLPPNRQYLVVQLAPQDAHVLALAVAANQSLRMVHRPFQDRERVTGRPDPGQFTHASRDTRQVEVINGVARGLERATID